MDVVQYIHLVPGGRPPPLTGRIPFKAVVIVAAEVDPDWQALVSDWLVESGCRCMMAWGRKCSEWDDSVDHANLRPFDYGDIPEDAFVMTTWHDHDSLKEVFWYSENTAFHPSLELDQTYIIHIAPHAQSTLLLQEFHDAQKE